MPFRTVVTNQPRLDFGELTHVITYQKDEERFDGTWRRYPGSLLIFAGGPPLAGSSVTFDDGPVAGDVSGHPLNLIFWGDWWAGPGSAKFHELLAKVQAMVSSPYFSELKQYGILQAPVLAKSMIVTRPAPPARESTSGMGSAIVDLIRDLIDDNNIQDNQDSPKPLYMVFMPDGFTLEDPNVLGAHATHYELANTFEGWVWAGWTIPDTVDATTEVLSHELVETLTDPEGDGWRWCPTKGPITEIADGLWVPGSGGFQAAYVNDVRVQSYWSNRHNASVIPINADYEARLSGRMVENSHDEVYRGTFRPGPEGAPLCSPAYPDCCYGDREFRWARFFVKETARVRLLTRRFRQPQVSWTINGSVLVFPQAGPLVFSTMANVATFDNNTAPQETTRAIQLVVTPRTDNLGLAGIDIASNEVGNFSVIVACTVTETAITGTVASGTPVCTPSISVSFEGMRLRFEDAYIKAVSDCQKSLLRKYKWKYLPTDKLGDRNPIDQISALIKEAGIPEYVRPEEYERIRLAAKAARVAQMEFGQEMAAQYATGLIQTIPALSVMQLKLRQTTRTEEA